MIGRCVGTMQLMTSFDAAGGSIVVLYVTDAGTQSHKMKRDLVIRSPQIVWTLPFFDESIQLRCLLLFANVRHTLIDWDLKFVAS